MSKITVGEYRKGEMQIVSGPLGGERVHFEAPFPDRVPDEMARFLNWFETHKIDPVLRAAIAHLWFETIHPMDDGNGRIGRAIMDKALAQADGTNQRFYSMSAQIHADKLAYYAILERSQHGGLDATDWPLWFLAKLDLALGSAEGVLNLVRRKTAFWDNFREGINERQAKIINILFTGFDGKLKTERYAKIAKCSDATAQRDLSDLVTRGARSLTRRRRGEAPPTSSRQLELPDTTMFDSCGRGGAGRNQRASKTASSRRPASPAGHSWRSIAIAR